MIERPLTVLEAVDRLDLLADRIEMIGYPAEAARLRDLARRLLLGEV